MGSGNVKGKKIVEIDCFEKSSEDSFKNEEQLKAVMFYDNEEIAKHEDLLVQAIFFDVPKINSDIFNYEKTILSKIH